MRNPAAPHSKAPTWNFSGETVFVSAGAWGIGRSVVSLFARAGAKVLFGDIDALHGEELSASLAKEGCEVSFVEVDFAHPDAWSKMLLAEPSWSPSVLVSNAGISGLGAVEDVDFARYDLVHAVNQRAGFLAAKSVVPDMKKRSAGSIVFVGSIMAQALFSHSALYVATKSAIVGMTQALALDLSPYNIRVNCVSPGFTKGGVNGAKRDRVPPQLWSAFAQKFSDKIEAEHALQQPLQICTDASDVANAIAFLCSPLARTITGIDLPIDGGLSLPVKSEPQTRVQLDEWTPEMEAWLQKNIASTDPDEALTMDTTNFALNCR